MKIEFIRDQRSNLSGKHTTNGHPAKKHIHTLLKRFEPVKILVCIVVGTFSS